MPSKPLVIPPPKSALEAAIDSVEMRRLQAEWDETVRLAEAIFPKDWQVRVEQFQNESFVQIRFIPAYGRSPTDALKKAIDWYRASRGSSIILPNR